MTIWKFPLDIIDVQEVAMPVGAAILTAAVQGSKICLWALCNGSAPPAKRRVAIYGTGHPLPDDPGKYVATVLMHNGALVLHVFEVLPTERN